MKARATWLGVSARPFVGFQIGGLVRYAVYGVLLVASLMFYVWSRVDVRASAAALESARWESAELRDDRDRLRLELAGRRDLARLAATAQSMGLSDEVPVVQVSLP